MKQLILLLFVYFSIGALISISARPGDLDITFGNGGAIDLEDLFFRYPRKLFLQLDGRIVVAVQDNFIGYSALKRMNKDGSPDPTFGNDGVLDLGESGLPIIAMLPDGKFLIYDEMVSSTKVRLFSANGIFERDFFHYNKLLRLRAFEVQPDGMIVTAGITIDQIEPRYVVLERRFPDGQIDPTFGTNRASHLISQGLGVKVLHSSDGYYLFTAQPFPLLGSGNVFKMTHDGQWDMTFGVNGNVQGTGGRIAVLSDGGFLLFGLSGDPRQTAEIRRFDSHGIADDSFGIGGVVTIPTEPHSFLAEVGDWLRVASDGKILVTLKGPLGFKITRLNSNGSIDQGFGNEGIVEIGGEGTTPTTLNLTPDNKVLVSGLGNLGNLFVRLLGGSVGPFDFDGDSKTDLSIFRPNSQPAAQWWFLRSSDHETRGLQFGNAEDIPGAADFTGDGKTDIAFWRPSTGQWFILRSEDDSFYAFLFGGTGDIPAPGDFDGDGKADPAVYRPSAGRWFILRSSDSGVSAVPFGVAEDKPTVADFDGDGKDDVAVYRPSVNQWWQLRSTAGVLGIQFGTAGDRTAIGDYTGDGKADVAFFRPSSGEWYVIRSEDNSFFAFPWGFGTDLPVPGDYDGDGLTDAAVWRESNATWYINGSTSGAQFIAFGSAGDVPLPTSVSAN